MLETKLLEEILGVATSTGADFAEVYWELTRNGTITLISEKIDAIADNTVSGVGIRAFLGTRTVYGSTSDLSREGLIRCAKSVAEAMGEGRAEMNIVLKPTSVKDIHPVRINPTTSDVSVKCDLLRAATSAARAYDPRIVQSVGNLMTVFHIPS